MFGQFLGHKEERMWRDNRDVDGMVVGWTAIGEGKKARSAALSLTSGNPAVLL